MANMESRMIRSLETVDRDHRGFTTASALMTVIQSLIDLAGAEDHRLLFGRTAGIAGLAGQDRLGRERRQPRERQRLHHRRRRPADAEHDF